MIFFLFIYNETPFDKACSNDLINIIEYLIDIIKEKEIIYKGIYILIHQYHFETIKLLFNKNKISLDFEYNDSNPLIESLKLGCFDLTHFILLNKINLNLLLTKIEDFIKDSCLMILEFIFDNIFPIDIPINSKNQTILHISIIKKRLKIIDFLIKKGANINITDIYNKKPFDYQS